MVESLVLLCLSGDSAVSCLIKEIENSFLGMGAVAITWAMILFPAKIFEVITFLRRGRLVETGSFQHEWLLAALKVKTSTQNEEHYDK